MKPPELEFANIPSVRMRDAAVRLQQIAKQMSSLIEERDKLTAKVIRVLGVGRYRELSVFNVRATTVHEHPRKGYKAVRARTRL